MTENETEVKDSKAYQPGTLYLMRETDCLTGEATDYIKIGIVHGNKAVEVRGKEHNTGNPRTVASMKDLASPAVQKLETQLHNEFARHRVSSNEWFYLPGALLDDMIARSEDLNAQLDADIDKLRAATKAKKPGKAPALAATPEATAIAEKLARNEELKKFGAAYKKSIAAEVERLTAGSTDWEYLFQISNRAEKTNFSAAVMKKEFKELYDEYCTVSKTSVTKKFPFAIEEQLEPDEAIEQLALPNLESLGDDVLALHQAHLQHWAAEAKLKWEAEFLEASLLDIAHGTEGIEGILVWNTRDSMKFDTERFQADHPDIYEQCKRTTLAGTTTKLAEWASYKH